MIKTTLFLPYVGSLGINPQTHPFFHDELLLVEIDLVGSLVDMADEG